MNANGPKIPKQEVMVVFDADMVAKPNFFTKVRAPSLPLAALFLTLGCCALIGLALLFLPLQRDVL